MFFELSNIIFLPWIMCENEEVTCFRWEMEEDGNSYIHFDDERLDLKLEILLLF